MVDDGRKVEQHSSKVVTERLTTTANTNSFELEINLSDRQTIRKRHRSSSPANNSDSSSTHGSTRSSSCHQSTSADGTRASSLKRSRKQIHQRRRADEESEESSRQPDTPPPPSNGTPAKRNGHEDDWHIGGKKVRIVSGGLSTDSVTITERRSKTSCGTISQSDLLFVDVNGDEESARPKTEIQIHDPSGSSPESPVDEEAKIELNNKLEAQDGATTSNIVKRLTRDELERLALEQMCVSIRERGIAGELERKLEAADAQLNQYRRRSEALHKQVSDLKLEVRRFARQSKYCNQPVAPPIKTTRSVGLQINLASHPSVTSQRPPVSEPKPNVTITPVVTMKKTPSITNSSQTTSNGARTTIISPTGNLRNLARVPIPPSFTMQSPGIASYVPQQTVPRYRTAPQRRSNEAPASAKIATYVNIGGVKSLPNSNVASKLQSNSVNITPVIPSGANQRPQGNPYSKTVAAMLVRARPATAGDSGSSSAIPQQQPACVPMARWSKVPASRATTVKKVTVPGRLPNVIDLADKDLEKERAVAGAGRPFVPRPMSKQTSTTASGFVPKGIVRRVALKSTTLNGRNPLTTKKSPNNHTKSATVLTHPAPLPVAPVGVSNPSWKAIAPKPSLDIKHVANGIVLSWNMQGNLSHHADIASYQVFAYQEGSDPPTDNGSVWKRVGEVKALPLPMVCTLTQFLEGHRYHFAVRAMDVHGRAGPYSEPGTTVLS